jgi:PAS domain S-box-containing protein
MTPNPEDTPPPAPRVGINADLLFDASPMPTWIFDAEDYAFLAVNRAACERYGYSEEEFLGMTLRDVCMSEDFPQVVEQLTRLPFSFEHRVVLRHWRKDGAVLFIEPARQGMEYNGHKAVFSVLNDVTDRVRAENALRESEERTRLIVQTSLDAVVEIDSDSYIMGWNRQAEVIFGWSQKEAIGRRLTDTIIPTQYQAAHLKGLEHFFKTGEGPVLNRRIEITACRRNGEEFPVELAITPIKTARSITFSASLRDIGERKSAEEALVSHQREIEALNVRLQRSMRETHHRVKNNLQIISALLDMQEMQYEEVVPISEIAWLRQHIMSLSAIHDLLTYQARDDSEVYDLSVKETMGKLVPILQSIVAGRAIDFTIEDLRLPVRQATTLTVLVNELVSNAVKHGKGRIGIHFFTKEGEAVLEVSDEGPGFPPDFDPVKGVNTGLELVQTLTRLDLNGKIRFENRPEGGAAVVLEFPMPGST